MGYGVNTWASQAGRARAAGSSKGKSTRTAKRKSSGSARRAKSKRPKQRRSLQKGGSLWQAAQAAGWTDRQSFEDWAGDPGHEKEVARLKARYQAYQESGR
jgi:hypothetical protein